MAPPSCYLHSMWGPAYQANPWKPWQQAAVGIGLGVLAGAAVGTIILMARPARAAEPEGLDEDAAVRQAISELGRKAFTVDLAARAYELAHPSASFPPEGADLEAWNRIVVMVQGAQIPPATGPDSDGDETAERMADWLRSLSTEQRREVREIIGADLWDPIAEASAQGDDAATRAALRTLKAAVEDQMAKSKLFALSVFGNLRMTLGTAKLDAFMEIMDDTVGLPAMNPAPNPATGTFWDLWRPSYRIHRSA